VGGPWSVVCGAGQATDQRPFPALRKLTDDNACSDRRLIDAHREARPSPIRSSAISIKVENSHCEARDGSGNWQAGDDLTRCTKFDFAAFVDGTAWLQVPSTKPPLRARVFPRLCCPPAWVIPLRDQQPL